MGSLTPPSKIAIKGKKKYYMKASLKSDITLVTISNFYIPRDIIDCPKVS